jgi:pimeloyl-ACP methyl ester carboxylesterase
MWLSKQLRRVRWKRVLLTVLVIYVVGIALVCLFPDRVVLFPSRDAIEIPGTTRELVASAVGTLEVWTTRTAGVRSGEPRAFVLAFNGNGSRAERELGRIESMWAGHAVELWAVNYPGYGGSGGAARLKDIPLAALAAYDALAQRAAGRPIFVSGHSLGTTAALYVAANRPVAGLVLHNPPPLRQLIMGRFGWFNLWIAAARVAAAVPPELDSIANARRCSAPVVFILAGGDTFVRPKYQQMVVDAYAGPKRLVRLAGYEHNAPVTSAGLRKVRPEIDWLVEQSQRPLTHHLP